MSTSPSLDRRHPLARADGVVLPPLAFGTTSLGNMPGTYGYEVDEARAHATVNAILDSPFPFLDTSRNYGQGESERRIGTALAQRRAAGSDPGSGLSDGAIVSTKLDRDPRHEPLRRVARPAVRSRRVSPPSGSSESICCTCTIPSTPSRSTRSPDRAARCPSSSG